HAVGPAGAWPGALGIEGGEPERGGGGIVARGDQRAPSRRRDGGERAGAERRQHDRDERLDERAARPSTQPSRTRPRWFTTVRRGAAAAPPSVTVPFSACPVESNRIRARAGSATKRTEAGSGSARRIVPSIVAIVHTPLLASNRTSSGAPSAIARPR